MARPSSGAVVERNGARGRSFAIRFRAGGARRFLTLGSAEEGWTRTRAEEELANVLADVRRGIWRAPEPVPVIDEPRPEQTFHEFASEWLVAREVEGLAARTIDDYRWALVNHLLPFFARHRLSAITVQEVDRYKLAKAAEGVLSANSINATITRLSQVLGNAVEYGLIGANPAAGKRRRLKGTRPRRPYVEPEQLPALLDAAERLLAGRGKPLLATLAVAGLRIGEALALERRDVNIQKATLAVGSSKTEAGVRIVDVTPALRDELAVWLDRLPYKRPTDLVFPTMKGRRDYRGNVRQRLLLVAVAKANVRLAELDIEPIGGVTLHGLRRTSASLRCAAGDDVAYTASQLGHEDPTFTLRVYTAAVKRRQRLSPAELGEFERALDWAQMGTNALEDTSGVALVENVPTRNPASEAASF